MSIMYSKKNFKLYKESSKGYIVHNIHKQFNIGHTHINNYGTAKYIINLAYHLSLPKRKLNNYLIESLIRISEDINYINELKKLIK